MTCIIGLLTDERIYVAGDSVGSTGWSKSVRADDKVFRVGNFLFGFTGSFRLAHLLMWGFRPPAHDPKDSTHKYMCTDFMNALRDRLRGAGCLHTKDGIDRFVNSSAIIVAYRDSVFCVEGDLQVGIPGDCVSDVTWVAEGCGGDFAMGALYGYLSVNKKKTHANYKKALTVALESAERFSEGVGAPFIIKSIPREEE